MLNLESTPWVRILSTLKIGFVVTFIAAAGLWSGYDSFLPRQPEASRGRTVELNTHGRFTYMTRGEQALLHSLIGLSVVLGVSAAFLDSARRRQAKRREDERVVVLLTGAKRS
jgi:hypothetical protein